MPSRVVVLGWVACVVCEKNCQRLQQKKKRARKTCYSEGESVCPHAQHDRIGMHDVGSNVTAGPTSALTTPIPPTTITKFRHCTGWFRNTFSPYLKRSCLKLLVTQRSVHEHVLRKRI
jgi:hypothetical protein